MATVNRRPKGHKWIQFTAPDGRRKTIRLGKTSKAQAQAAKRHVENLLAAGLLGDRPDFVTAQWLASLSDVLHQRVVAAGLAQPRDKHTLAELLRQFRDSLNVKTSTEGVVGRTIENLERFFDGDQDVRQMTEAQADQFKAWLQREGGHKGKGLADATVSRRCRRARQILELAIKKRWITVNPFSAVKGRGESNRSRDYFVDRDLIDRILKAASDAEFRLILALCRFGGLRCPSEIVPLHWSAVNWTESRLTVASPKTEQHEDHESRIIPIFTEIRPYLDELWDQAPAGAELMFPNHQVSGAALRKKLEKLCRSLGIPLWRKPFNNMRATRDTELRDSYPAHVCVAWLGHSEEIARKHYLQIAKEHWDTAIRVSPHSEGCDVKPDAP
jgi:integrase